MQSKINQYDTSYHWHPLLLIPINTGMEDAIQGQSVEISLAVTEVMKDNVKVRQ